MPYNITPSTYAKEKSLRPQQVFNWIKQGAPHEKRDKTYIDPVELEKWVAERTKAKAEKKATAASGSSTGQGASYFEEIPQHYRELLRSNKVNHRVTHFCFNCEVDMEFLSELFWNVDGFHYLTSYCLSCHQNKRWLDVEDEQVLMDLLDEKRSWFVPGLTSDQEREELKQFQGLRTPQRV